MNKSTMSQFKDDADLVVCIAASTGGPEALRQVLSKLPANIPPTLVVQHMPALFTKNLARSLSQECAFPVREAADGDTLRAGVVLLAPGDFHMTLAKIGGRYFVRVKHDDPVHGVRPAADPLFDSVARAAGARAIGVVLTGMGRDGAQGILKMRQAGAFTIAQDEPSCVVFGMPKEAIALGGIQIVSPLAKIPAIIISEIARRTIAKAG
ncbi:MAG: chemotaxis protein CheB [Betaproteobacteria bacterium]|nr:chemotaxis protein CheB [Betaproteobacteria bacterium]